MTSKGFHTQLRIGRAVGRALAALACALLIPGLSMADPLPRGAAYLESAQGADGGWTSPRVRTTQATAEALRALQALNSSAAARSRAADFLLASPAEDNDDLGRRIDALAAEGRNVDALATELAAGSDPLGGWGLLPDLAADPLDGALALTALASQPSASDELVRHGLGALLGAQAADGGWACVDGAEGSEMFCSSHALLALVPYQTRYFLGDAPGLARGFLIALRNADGSYGPAGEDAVFNTALAALAVTRSGPVGAERLATMAWLESRQAVDGGWEADPYTTALALRAYQALASVPHCGDGAVNVAGEACDDAVPAGVTCQSVGLGSGTLACSAQCTLDTSGCSALPTCGDNLRNQSFEVCDGTDLAGATCTSQGFATGTLACAADCLSLNVSGCTNAPTCGDGQVNQSGESCDLSDLNGMTCGSLGLGGGQLSCSSDCNLDTSQCDAASFVLDNKGREFFVGFMANPLGSATSSVQLTSDVPTSVTVQYPVNTPSFSQTVAVNPGQVTVVNLPTASNTGWTAGKVLNNAVRVSAPDDFVAYVVNRAPYTSDAGMAFPVDALGTSYIVTTYKGSDIVSSDRSQFLVIAAFDNTNVTITPTATVRIPSPGVNAPPNVPFQVTLGRGQGFRAEAAFASNDLTGTVIESDRPVAVLNGNLCTNVPSRTSYCDHIFEVAHPLRSWGTSALVANLPNRTGGSIYRIVASVDGTQVTLDGALQATLNRGKFFETGPLTGSHVFAANQPIFVTQFMTGSTSAGASLGDPAMANMIPPDQYLKSYTFATVGGTQFRNHFLTLIAPDASIGQVLLDGTAVAASQFKPIGTTGYSSALLPLTEGSHTTSSPQPHGITVEGINQDDSYIYPGGARLEFINQFCGDGAANREAEACDANDFRGANCASFGFSAGLLRCTTDCRVDTSQCSGFTIEDKDNDGYPATEDCNDLDHEVNPGMPEVPGNGIDDDCNPATPDVIPVASLSCTLNADQISYLTVDPVRLAATITNTHATYSLTGLSAALIVRTSGGTGIFDEIRSIAPLPPGARAQQSFVLSASGQAPGSYVAELTLTGGGATLAVCSAGFAIESSASTAAGLIGDLTVNPEQVNSGDPAHITYTVQNQGNDALVDLQLRVLIVNADSGAVAGELLKTVTLQPGQSFNASELFPTTGLATNTTYMVVLLAKPGGTDTEQTLDNAVLTVFNAPPDCSGATADPETVESAVWPPNHEYVPVTIGGVIDPDGDPITLKVKGLLQDERTDDPGSGNTCPDAQGVGTSSPAVRAERSGRLDGRVYHIFFEATDGRGGKCQGEVKVCVPHDVNDTCVDQGPLFDSTACN